MKVIYVEPPNYFPKKILKKYKLREYSPSAHEETEKIRITKKKKKRLRKHPKK